MSRRHDGAIARALPMILGRHPRKFGQKPFWRASCQGTGTLSPYTHEVNYLDPTTIKMYVLLRQWHLALRCALTLLSQTIPLFRVFEFLSLS